MSKYIDPIKAKDLPPVTLNFIKKIGRMAYSGYSGRKWALEFGTSYQMENYWDGGSKTYSMAVNLKTLEIVAPSSMTTNPMNQAAHARFDIPMGFAIIEHVYFCGKDAGIRLVIRPDETSVIGYVPRLPEPSEVVQIEG